MLAKKNIIVTGSEGLLGKAICLHIQSCGGTAIGVDMHQHNAPHYYCCDVTNAMKVEQTIQNILATYDEVHGLVNCAYPRTSDWGKAFDNESVEMWNKNIELQTGNVFNLIKAIVPHFIASHGGAVVNMASIYGVVGNNFSLYENTQISSPSAYSLIKGGIINFTKYLASLYGKHNVRFNCVSPGGVYNDHNETFVVNYKKLVPLQRMALPADIAPSVSFLLSDGASYITGHNLVVDGGWTII